ncbi:hypothetical protein B484DRAFT_276935 [Ochromonadaceae sp. CCMP2298]|nr:hypothetical protein B484DRAFT_292202 [Ochromonadaceae sp. CCMP2298]KAJ1443784.1 hypothetical protein B484DRAFT_276935 [Ochromonadaceae sp. CCMP2298]
MGKLAALVEEKLNDAGEGGSLSEVLPSLTFLDGDDRESADEGYAASSSARNAGYRPVSNLGESTVTISPWQSSIWSGSPVQSQLKSYGRHKDVNKDVVLIRYNNFIMDLLEGLQVYAKHGSQLLPIKNADTTGQAKPRRAVQRSKYIPRQITSAESNKISAVEVGCFLASWPLLLRSLTLYMHAPFFSAAHKLSRVRHQTPGRRKARRDQRNRLYR